MADLSPAWLTQRLQKEILDVTVQDMSGAGGLNCLMLRFWEAKKEEAIGGCHGGATSRPNLKISPIAFDKNEARESSKQKDIP